MLQRTFSEIPRSLVISANENRLLREFGKAPLLQACALTFQVAKDFRRLLRQAADYLQPVANEVHFPVIMMQTQDVKGSGLGGAAPVRIAGRSGPSAFSGYFLTPACWIGFAKLLTNAEAFVMGPIENPPILNRIDVCR